MTTVNKTSSAARVAPATRARLTTLDTRTGYVTIINTYAVKPERAEALQGFLVPATNETIRYVPGFVSANLHVNFDRTQVVNYAQWKSREAIAAARESPKVVAFMREQFQIADSFTPILYKLRKSVAPVSSAGIRSV
jgi:quinol monooxygenase YgiN